MVFEAESAMNLTQRNAALLLGGGGLLVAATGALALRWRHRAHLAEKALLTTRRLRKDMGTVINRATTEAPVLFDPPHCVLNLLVAGPGLHHYDHLLNTVFYELIVSVAAAFSSATNKMSNPQSRTNSGEEQP